MPASHFRLDALERLRRQQREQCQLDVSAAEEAKRGLATELVLVESRLVELQAVMRSGASPGQVDLQRLCSQGDFCKRLQTQLTQLGQQRAQLEDEIARRRRALVEADRELKTLEKLRERQHQQHETGSRRADQRLQDDAAARSFGRESRH
jgi:flagellar export protein FliJ